MSYAVYLYHYPITHALNGGVISAGHPLLRFLWLAPATAGISIALATASYYGVERPLLRLKEWRARLARPA